MSKVSIADVLELSVADRIRLMGDIWDSLSTLPHAIPLTDAQREELDRRLEDYKKNPDEGTPWETVKNRILSRE